MTDEAATPSASPRRRAGRGSGTVRAAPSTAKYRKLKHRFPPTPVVSEDELEAIHDTSLTILEEMGMDFMHPEARAILKKAGADVRDGSERVRFDSWDDGGPAIGVDVEGAPERTSDVPLPG